MRRVQRSIRDARGAVFVEKLIALLPLLLTFFFGWELAEVAAARLVVQRASAAAGRAAMVVLPDDPMYYADEPTDSYTGARRADIELAAGMVLSAVPQMSQDFEVDVSAPPRGFGTIDVTVKAPYECGSVGILCTGRDSLMLSATTTHAYHGASYAYSAPEGGGVSATPQALRASSAGPASVAANVQALSANSPKPKPGGGTSRKGGGCERVPLECTADGGFSGNPYVTPRSERTHARQLGSAEGSSLADAAQKARCRYQKATRKKTGRNFAAVAYRCKTATGQYKDHVRVTHSDPDIGHSEANLLRDYEKHTRGKECEITGLFTEREPCPSCRSALAGRDDVSDDFEVTYKFEWNAGDVNIPSIESIRQPNCLGLLGRSDDDETRLCQQLDKAINGDGARPPSNVNECVDSAMKLDAFKRQKRIREESNLEIGTLADQCPP